MYDFCKPTLQCENKCSQSIFIPGIDVCAVFEKHMEEFLHISVVRSGPIMVELQWGLPIIVLGCQICDTLDKHASDVYLSLLQRDI